MSVADRLLAGEQVEVADLRKAMFRSMFGDKLGATLALTALVWIGITWRLGFASNDQYTFANALLAVADGQLHITESVYGPSSGATPGTYLVDGQVYGRNYGVVFLSALWYVPLRALSVVADVRVLLAGLWSLALVGASTGIGAQLGRRRAGLIAGTIVAGAAFGLSLLVVEPVWSWWLPLIALQLTTALAAAVLTVVCYRLLTRVYNRRVAVAGAVAAIAATPVGFWATLPKRHTVTAMFVICAMYTLYRSRDAQTSQSATRFRALTYVWPALLAWVHAPLGFVLLVAVAAVDLPTARSNRPRTLLFVVATFGLALLPFLLTNIAISGNPLMPPRLLPGYGGDALGPDAGGVFGSDAGGSAGSSAGSGGSGAGGEGGSGAGGEGGISIGLPAPVETIIGRFIGSYAVFLAPEKLFRIFVYTGYVPISWRPSLDAAINLSVFSSMPLLGGMLAYPALAVRRLNRAADWHVIPRNLSPVRVVDVFTVLFVTGLCGLYLQVLPTNHMLTVRYLHPLYLIGVYWLVRIPTVRTVIATEPHLLTRSYGATVLLGVVGYLGAITTWGLVLDESVQLYALVALVAAAGVGMWALIGTLRGGHTRLGAITLGVAAGAMTVYLLVAGLSLFPNSGEFLLPMSRAISEQIHYTRLIGSAPPFYT